MQRIGIYLESDRACGGAHQYNRALVAALAGLPADTFSVSAIYAAPHWREMLEAVGIHGEYYIPSRVLKVLMGVWRRLGFSISLWRDLADKIHPLVRMMKRHQCDLWIFPSQDALSYWIPVKSLVTIHDLMHRYEKRFPEVGAASEYAWREFHYRNISRYATGILVDSVLGKQHVMESYHVSPEKCHVLPYIPPFNFSETSSLSVHEIALLPKKYLFYPAQFWHHKNHATLLKAIAQLKKDFPDLHLVLVGSRKNGADAIDTLVKALDLSQCVHFLGLVDDAIMPVLYRGARALVMPTFFGPTNIPPLEAFVCKCPVLISDIYAMKEQLGDAAIYFDPHSVDALAAAIQKIWTDDALCQTLIARGQRKVAEWGIVAFRETLHNILLKT